MWEPRWASGGPSPARIAINDSHKVFHSFRHGFVDRCRAIRLSVGESVEKALVGHVDGETLAQYGSEGYPLDVQITEIEAGVVHQPDCLGQHMAP